MTDTLNHLMKLGERKEQEEREMRRCSHQKTGRKHVKRKDLGGKSQRHSSSSLIQQEGRDPGGGETETDSKHGERNRNRRRERQEALNGERFVDRRKEEDGS